MDLQARFPEIVQRESPLAPHTILRIGGPAEYLISPRTKAETAAVVEACRMGGIPLRILGGGTNLLIADEGIRGAVMRFTSPELTSIAVQDRTVVAAGGAWLIDLITVTTSAGLAGFETLVGINATVGGAIRFNAGDRSGEISDTLTSIEVIDSGGAIRIRDRSELHFGDHQSSIDDPVVLGVTFQLDPDRPESIVKRMRRAWVNRKAAEPLSHEAAVRVFRDPKGTNAAQAIERAGLARMKVGAAEISDRNANYIVARPGTTAKDVRQLAESIQEQVRTTTGISLEQELKFW